MQERNRRGMRRGCGSGGSGWRPRQRAGAEGAQRKFGAAASRVLRERGPPSSRSPHHRRLRLLPPFPLPPLPPWLPSPQVPSDTCPFNEAPEMKARQICEAGKEALRSGKFDQIRINFAK